MQITLTLTDTEARAIAALEMATELDKQQQSPFRGFFISSSAVSLRSQLACAS